MRRLARIATAAQAGALALALAQRSSMFTLLFGAALLLAARPAWRGVGGLSFASNRGAA